MQISVDIRLPKQGLIQGPDLFRDHSRPLAPEISRPKYAPADLNPNLEFPEHIRWFDPR